MGVEYRINSRNTHTLCEKKKKKVLHQVSALVFTQWKKPPSADRKKIAITFNVSVDAAHLNDIGKVQQAPTSGYVYGSSRAKVFARCFFHTKIFVKLATEIARAQDVYTNKFHAFCLKLGYAAITRACTILHQSQHAACSIQLA